MGFGDLEENFPRGKKREREETLPGDKAIKKPSPNPKIVNDLFKESPVQNESSDKVVTKRKKKPDPEKGPKSVGAAKKKAPNSEKELVRGEPEKIDRNVLPGTLLLGIVESVEPYLLRVSLPGGMSGVLSINEVSVDYTRLLKKWADSTSTHADEIFTLEQMFSPGTRLTTKVLAREDNSDDQNLRLTINPREVNFQFSPAMLVKGFNLSGCISSVEDHGYTVDIGVQGIVAFADSKHYSGPQLRVGQYVQAVVTNSKVDQLKSGESRNVGLKIDVDFTKYVVDATAKREFFSLLPGLCVKGKIVSVLKEGIRVDFCGNHVGHAHMTLLSKPLKEYENQSESVFIVVSVCQSTKIVSLSDMPHLLGHRLSVPISDRFELEALHRMSVQRVLARSNHVVFSCDGARALYNESVKHADKFSRKISRCCQIVGFALVENALLVKMKSEKATEFINKLKLINVGAVVKGIVKRHLQNSIVVELSDPVKVLANVAVEHLVDFKPENSEEAKAARPVGSEIKARVLNVDINAGAVQLTCQPTLVNSKLSILRHIDEAVIDQVYCGIVCHVFEKTDSVLVRFYKQATGVLFLKQTPYPIDMFYKGCPILVKATKVDLSQNRIFLQLEHFNLARYNRSTKSTKFDKSLIGSVVDCLVVRSSKRGVLVKLPSEDYSILQKTHASDFPELAHDILSRLTVGSALPMVVIGDSMVSLKKEIIKFSCDSSTVSWTKAIKDAEKNELIKAGMTFPVTVVEQKDFGIFVVLFNGLHGFVPNKLLTQKSVSKPSEIYTIGQTLLATVKIIDEEKNRIVLSTKGKDTDPHSAERTANIFSNYLSEKKFLLDGKKIGVVTGEQIEEVKEDRVICKSGLIIRDKVNFVSSVSSGSSVKAAVIDVDPVTGDFFGTLDPDLVSSMSFLEADPPEQFEVVVLRVHAPRYAIGVWRQKDRKPLILHVAAQKFYNDVEFSESLQVGKPIKVTNFNRHPLPFCVPVEFVNSQFHLKEKRKEKAAKTQNETVNDLLSKDMEMFYRINPLEEVGLKQGALIVVTVSAIKDKFVQILIDGRIPGKICKSEIADTIEGEKPQSIKVGHPIKVRVVGTSLFDPTMEVSFPLGVNCSPMTDTDKLWAKKFVVEATMRRNVVSKSSSSLHLNRTPLLIGRSVFGYVFAYEHDAKRIILKITHFTYGILPFVHATKCVSHLKNVEKYFPIGSSVKVLVESKLDNYCYAVTVAGVTSARIKPFSRILGEVVKVTPLWAFVSLKDESEGRIHITDARDMYGRDPMSLIFYEGQVVNCFVKSGPTEQDPFYLLSTRKSRLKGFFSSKDMEIRSSDDVFPGALIGGFVAETVSTNADDPLVRVDVQISPDVMVVVEREYMPFDLTAKMMYCGKWVRVSIIEKTVDEKGTIVIKGSLRNQETNVGELYLQKEEFVADGVAVSREKRKRTVTEKEVSVSPKKSKVLHQDKKEKKVEKIKDKKKKKVKKSSTFEDEANESLKQSESVKALRLPLECSGWDFNFCGGDPKFSFTKTETKVQTEVTKTSDETPDDVIRSGVVDANTKGRHAALMEEEKTIHAKEKELLLRESPQSLEDFERLVVSSPNESMAWIKFMAFCLQESEVEKARNVAQRALKAINFRREDEKMNVWVALLNLEMNYGSEADVLETFKRAVQENDELKIKQHMAVIYSEAGKFELAEKFYCSLVKKFPTEKQVWYSFFQLYFDHKKKDAARRLMERAVSTLTPKLHIPILTRFAGLEFKSGDAEHGRTIFEQILANFPKRVDVWNLYADKLVVAGDIDGARAVLERASSLQLGPCKMKPIFKKYLAFEKEHGTENEINEVKRKAVNFVEKKREALSEDD